MVKIYELPCSSPHSTRAETPRNLQEGAQREYRKLRSSAGSEFLFRRKDRPSYPVPLLARSVQIERSRDEQTDRSRDRELDHATLSGDATNTESSSREALRNGHPVDQVRCMPRRIGSFKPRESSRRGTPRTLLTLILARNYRACSNFTAKRLVSPITSVKIAVSEIIGN